MDDWGVNDEKDQDLDRKRDALIGIVFNVNPDTLTDDEWARRWHELKWASRNGFLPFELD